VTGGLVRAPPIRFSCSPCSWVLVPCSPRCAPPRRF
jgi:hypothetical protein